MACSSCGKPRISTLKNLGSGSVSGTKVVSSQSITTASRVQTATASNPNSPKRKLV